MNKQLEQGKPRIFFTGVGGQGTLTATKLLAQTALASGLEAVAGEVHGMAQRGGVVESALLLGGWRSPRLDFGEADIILGFEPLESLRSLPYLAEGGVLFSGMDPIPPISVSLGAEEYPKLGVIKEEVGKLTSQNFFIPCNELGLVAGSRHAGNCALLGALCASEFVPFGLDELLEGIRCFLPEKLRDANQKAARLGAEWFEKEGRES